MKLRPKAIIGCTVLVIVAQFLGGILIGTSGLHGLLIVASFLTSTWAFYLSTTLVTNDRAAHIFAVALVVSLIDSVSRFFFQPTTTAWSLVLNALFIFACAAIGFGLSFVLPRNTGADKTAV